MPKMKLKMVLYPDKRLRQTAKKISNPNSPEMKKIIKEMATIMEEQNGVGLAGPQVGIMERIFLVYTEEGPLPLINPEIIHKSKKTDTAEEGCLSIPKTFGLVKRPYKIKVKATSITGELLEFDAEGLFSRVIQHELDHLDGILFIDKVVKYTQKPDDFKKE